jgi:Ni/Fe-hydrogenase b-type cytochrome subunit
MGDTPRQPQPLLIRITHWVNVPALALMAMSGLQILLAYPYFGPQGAMYEWVPLQGWESPDFLRAGHWLAGARHLHFALAWLLVANALAYLIYLGVSGEWRRRYFWPPRDTKPAIHQLRYYLRLRKDEPPIDLYNSLQRSAYTGALVLAIVEVLSGLAIYKPVQFHHLVWLMGGYDGARVVHFLGLLALVGFVISHVIMVALHPKSLREMITGGKAPASSPELPTAVAPEPASVSSEPDSPPVEEPDHA